MMKHFYSFYLLLCLLLFTSKPVEATHIVGADITYACTSTPGVFEVTLVLYRDCDGVDFCFGGCGTACTQVMSIMGADSSCASSAFGSITLSLVNVRDYDQKPNCPSSKNTCTNMGCTTPGTFTPGIERYEFKGYADIGPTSGIPSSCCNIRFAFELCCRNGSISTGAANQNFYADAIINRCYSVSPCNSSPQFTNEPYDILCGGENFIYNNGASDPDRDSLSFEFTPALQGFGSSVTYNAPFAYDKPMPWTGNAAGTFPAGIRCDPQTGDIMFTPGNATSSYFVGIVAILVKQWKTIGGVPTVIGLTRRDIQMTVSPFCPPNNPPRFTTVPPYGTNPNFPKIVWEACEGSQLCFDITARDTDHVPPTISDTTTIQWNGVLASLGATFTPNFTDSTRPRQGSYRFCWTPPVGSASDIPYMTVFKAFDSRCPFPGRMSRAFTIMVKTLPEISIVKNISNCGVYALTYSNSTPNAPVSTKWIIGKAPNDTAFTAGADTFNTGSTPDLHFNTTGKYLVQLHITRGACSKILYDTLTIDTAMTQSLHYTVKATNLSCNDSKDGMIEVHGQKGVPPYMYRKVMNGPFANDSIFENLTAGTYTISVRDQNLCITTFTQTVTAPPPIVAGTITGKKVVIISTPETYSITPHAGLNYAWSIAHGTIISGQYTSSVQVTWDSIGTGQIGVAVYSDSTCGDTATLTVNIGVNGLNELARLFGLEVFPNPTSGLLNITLKTLPSNRSLKLYDIHGRLIVEQELKLNQQLNLENLPQGIYLLKVGDYSGQIIKR